MKDYSLAAVDGNYICWRSFYAHTMLSIKQGKKQVGTGLAYGFMQSLMLILRAYPAKTVAIAWDSKESRRRRIYAGYKGNRKKDDVIRDEFGRQLTVIQDILKYSPFPEYTHSGEEADDVVASLVSQSDGRNLIVGSDHDLFQLINKNTQMLVLRANSFEEVWSRRIFKEKKGIDAQKFWQVMSLTGDSGDCVPGLRGIGEKTAIKLLNKYPGFVKRVLKSGSMPEELEAYFEKKYGSVDEVIKTIKLARKLTALNKKIKLMPVKKKPNLKRMVDALSRYQFSSMLEDDRYKLLKRSFRD